MEKMGEECRLGYGEDAVLNYGGKPNHNSLKSLESHRDKKLTRLVISRVQRKKGPGPDDANRPNGATNQRSSGPRPFRMRFSGRYYGRIRHLCLISGQQKWTKRAKWNATLHLAPPCIV